MKTGSTVNQNIDTLLRAKKLTQQELAQQMGLTKQTINNWITGTAQIPLKHLVSLLKLFSDVNARWLLTGEGDMGDDEKTFASNPRLEGKIEILESQLKEKEDKIAELYKIIGRLEKK